MNDLPSHIECAAEEAHQLFNATVEQLRYLLGHADAPGAGGLLPAMSHTEVMQLVTNQSVLFNALLQSMTISAAAHNIQLEIDQLRCDLVRELDILSDTTSRIG